jgi:hypothetical protein
MRSLADGTHFRVLCPKGHAQPIDLPVVVRCADGRFLFVPGLETDADGDHAAFAQQIARVTPEVAKLAVDADGRVEISQTARGLLVVILSDDTELRGLEQSFEALLEAYGDTDLLAVISQHPELLSAKALFALRIMAAAEALAQPGLVSVELFLLLAERSG